MADTIALMATLVMAATTFALRYAGFAIMAYVKVTPKIELFLERMSVSVLVAIVASSIASGGLRTATAVTFGMAVMLILKSPVAAMVIGIAAGAFWSAWFV